MSTIEFSPDGLDHIIYACSEIEQGMDEIESLLGVRPVRGGSHAQFGTHNALLSLGPGIYLEVIARDPELDEPQHGALIDFPTTTRSRLVTWVYRTSDIESLANNSSLGVGAVDTGTRKNPDGSEIHWQLTNPYAMPMDGAVPFLINWGNTVHPSTVLPPGGQLTKVVIEHPDADRLRDVLSALSSGVEVIAGESFGIAATIDTENGPVVLT